MKRAKSAESAYQDTARMLKAAGHGSRLAILSLLKGGARCVSDIQETLGISQPNLSQHLALLKRVGLIDSQASGPLRCYYLLRPAMAGGILDLAQRAQAAEPRGRDAVIEEALRSRPARSRRAAASAPAKPAAKPKPAAGKRGRRSA